MAEGVYTIDVKAEYDDKEITETLQLTKAECKRPSVIEEPEEEEEVIIIDKATPVFAMPEYEVLNHLCRGPGCLEI